MLVLMMMSCNLVLETTFLLPNGPAAHFFRPSLEDTCCIPIHDIITKVNPPSYGTTSRFYCFNCDEINYIKKLMLLLLYIIIIDDVIII